MLHICLVLQYSMWGINGFRLVWMTEYNSTVPLKIFATIGGGKANKKWQLNVGSSVPGLMVNIGRLATDTCNWPKVFSN